MNHGFLISNFFIGFNPFSLKLHIIRILSILLILYLIYKNSNQGIYSLSLLIPLSQNKIDYVHEFEIKSLNYYNEKGSVLYIQNLTTDLKVFLNNLNENDNYWISLFFYPEISGYANEEGIKLSISDPILINKNSDTLLLTKFIINFISYLIYITVNLGPTNY